jgi:hypothetical protein
MTELQTNLAQLEALYEARHKTDHVFINWWVGTLLLELPTLLLYPIYRFFRNIHRRDAHFKRTIQFNHVLNQTINLLTPQETIENTTTPTLLNTSASQLAKPLHWWIPFGLCLLGLIFSEILPPLIASHFNPTLQGYALERFELLTGNLLYLPFNIYLYSIMYGLLKDYAELERLDINSLYNAKMRLSSIGIDSLNTLNYQPYCRFSAGAKSAFKYVVLTILTLGLNWIYVDYRLTVEAQKRFAESARVQGAILQALKQLAEASTELTEAIENA